MVLFPVKLEFLLVIPPNALGTLTDASGTLMFRTKGRESRHLQIHQASLLAS
jgi:hypothetical protein